jgi:hypothetical protein
MINSIANWVDAELNGQTFFSCWRKQPTQTTGAGIWFDLSMSPGNPVPNYYAASPNIAIALAQSTDGGIPHGSNVAQLGYTKYLKMITGLTITSTAVPLPMILCDYLMFYPFVDMSDTNELGITLTTGIPLPRYPTGAGVQIMAVEVAGQSGVGNPQFIVTYTNQSGVSGRKCKNVACNTQVTTGTIINTAVNTAFTTGPFIPLQEGDTGVRKIDSVRFLTPDIGLISFVLVKPIATHFIRAVDAPAERNYFQDFSVAPVIQDDAYLNFIVQPNGTLASVNLIGSIQTVWG